MKKKFLKVIVVYFILFLNFSCYSLSYAQDSGNTEQVSNRADDGINELDKACLANLKYFYGVIELYLLDNPGQINVNVKELVEKKYVKNEALLTCPASTDSVYVFSFNIWGGYDMYCPWHKKNLAEMQEFIKTKGKKAHNFPKNKTYKTNSYTDNNLNKQVNTINSAVESSNTREILLKAATDLDIEKMKELIKNGCGIKDFSQDSIPVLISVINLKYSAFKRKIRLRWRADNSLDTSELEFKSKKLEMFKLLVENGAEYNVSDMYGKKLIGLAVDAKESEIVKYLLTKKIDITKLDKYNDDLLYHAVVSRSLDTIKAVVESEYGPDLMKDAMRATALAASNEYKLDILKYLVEKGARINYNSNIMWTPLKAAIVNKNVAGFKYLVEKGADLNVINGIGENCYFELTNGGISPEANEKAVEIARILSEKKISANVKNKYGETVLMKAARNGNIPLMKFLIDAGVDVNVRANNGLTALGYAKKSKQSAAIDFLNSVKAAE